MNEQKLQLRLWLVLQESQLLGKGRHSSSCPARLNDDRGKSPSLHDYNTTSLCTN